MANKTVGPGAFTESTEAPKPLLEGASEFDYVEIFNPLPVDFSAKVASTHDVTTPQFEIRNEHGITKDMDDVRKNYGLDLNNPDHKAKKHIYNQVLLPSGKTTRLLGDVAQVVVRQLVAEIMQREGNKLFMADPYKRRETEEKIVRGRGSVNEFLGGSPVSVREQVNEAMEKANDEEFPGLAEVSDNNNERSGTAPESGSDGSESAGTSPTGADKDQKEATSARQSDRSANKSKPTSKK